MNSRGRLPIIVVLCVSLLGASATREWADHIRHVNGETRYGSAAGLSRMNSYALALLLGGLRGPLVMFLWPSAETQKQQKNLEDFDTKIELIRLLQAEFDSVHLYEMWNKAYNISVQMTNLSNKYRAILDAINYGEDVSAEKPNNINIISEIGRLYFNKLGLSAEKAYYRERVREDSMARKDMTRITMPLIEEARFRELALDAGMLPRKVKFSPDDVEGFVNITIPKTIADAIKPKFELPEVTYVDRPRVMQDPTRPGWQASELAPRLDEKGNILPEYLAVRAPRPANWPAGHEWNDGSELQYLKQFEPFPYGISTLALGYNYAKQAQVLQSEFNKVHLQAGRSPIDSGPALALEFWAKEEWTRGTRAELEAFDRPVPSDRMAMELPTDTLPVDTKIVRPVAYDEAVFSYDRAAMVATDCLKEFDRHLKNDTTNVILFQSHREDMDGLISMVNGDADYLRAMRASPEQRKTLLASAAKHYRAAEHRYELSVLSRYIPDDVAEKLFPAGVTKSNFQLMVADNKISSDQLRQIETQARTAILQNPDVTIMDDFTEYDSYIRRIEARLKAIEPSTN